MSAENKQCLYFAYGSNMSLRRLQARVPSAQKLCRAKLPFHQLRFHKQSHHDGSAKCDAFFTGALTDNVEGVVYLFDEAEQPQLDSVEGVSHGYEIKQVSLVTLDGELVAYTYIATDINNTLRPFDWYMHHVLVGAKENQLPRHYVDEILAIPVMEDTNESRRQRELALYD
jgi:gamma-glutamylcyclotransferase (GGCT)/AIG2-like uncharacterized protein YtfP